MRRSSRNPVVGSRPDLFTQFGETPVRASIEELSEERLRDLPREAFTDDEFARLDEEIQEHIHEQDPKSRGRIENMVKEFKKRHDWLERPDEQYVRDSFEADFDQQISQPADELAERARRYDLRRVERIFTDFSEEGYSDAQIEEALGAALQESENYETTYFTSEYHSAFFKASASESFYIDRSEIDEILEGMYPDEIEIALEKINRVTNLNLDAEDLKKRHGIEIDDYAQYYADMDPVWDRVIQAMNDTLSGQDTERVPEVGPPPEERILHRYEDGAYVLDLLPEELSAENRDAEGKRRGLCVGDPQYGYARALREGNTKILSLREADHTKVFTIEVRLKPDGKIEYVRQIKAAHNAIPVASDVPRLMELLEKLGLPWKKIKDIKDLKPALQEVKGLPPIKENPDDGYHCGFCRPHWED